MEHTWMTDPTYKGPDAVKCCTHAGCTVRRWMVGTIERWQAAPRGRWTSSVVTPMPTCAAAAREADIAKTTPSPILTAEWEVDDDGYVAPKGGGAPLDISNGDHLAQAWAAAPDMARALKHVWDSGALHVAPDGPIAKVVRAALLKAGVTEAELRGEGA